MASQIKTKEIKELFNMSPARELRNSRHPSLTKSSAYLTPAEQAEAAAAHKVEIGHRGMITILTRLANA